MGPVAEVEAHQHRRPGGLVAVAECRCPDAGAWPIPEGGASPIEDAPEPVAPDVRAVEDTPEPSVPLFANTRAWLAAVRAAVASRARSGAVRSRGSLVRAFRWYGRGLARVAGGAAGMVKLTVAVVSALVMSLGGAAQVAGVGIGTWAAWEFEPIAGKLVLAVGLLFLGGAVRRVVTEVRDGSTR